MAVMDTQDNYNAILNQFWIETYAFARSSTFCVGLAWEWGQGDYGGHEVSVYPSVQHRYAIHIGTFLTFYS